MADAHQPQHKNTHIHLMGICGVGMSSLAGMLKEKGYNVTGSDRDMYPPASAVLHRLAILVKKGYSPFNLAPRPDLVVVGNVITRDNPEAVELLRLGIPYLSMPQALRKFGMNHKKSIVISGTHGKTTTSALTAWILEQAGMNPSFMIGGIAQNFGRNFKSGDGPYFVVEGDEYDTAFFDKGPKFLHYNPFLTLIHNIEFDHADIYRDLDAIRNSFRRLVEITPEKGILCVNIDDPVAAGDTVRSKVPRITYGMDTRADLYAGLVTYGEDGTDLTIMRDKKEYLRVRAPLYGNHNLYNILAAVCISSMLDVGPQTISSALATFKGAKRRLEVIGNFNDILVIDDFAHHPTAVRETIEAIKRHHGSRRLVAVFEPRSNSSRRNVFQDTYSGSFDSADLVLIPEPGMTEKIPPDERLSSEKLVRSLTKKGIRANRFKDSNDLFQGLTNMVKKGDMVLFMSNGAFDGVQEKFLSWIKAFNFPKAKGDQNETKP